MLSEGIAKMQCTIGKFMSNRQCFPVDKDGVFRIFPQLLAKACP